MNLHHPSKFIAYPVKGMGLCNGFWVLSKSIKDAGTAIAHTIYWNSRVESAFKARQNRLIRCN